MELENDRMNKKGTKGLERFYVAKWGSAMDPGSGFSKVKKIDGQGKKKIGRKSGRQQTRDRSMEIPVNRFKRRNGY